MDTLVNVGVFQFKVSGRNAGWRSTLVAG